MLRYVVVVMLLLLSGAPALPAPVAGEFVPSYFDGDGDGVFETFREYLCALGPLPSQTTATETVT